MKNIPGQKETLLVKAEEIVRRELIQRDAFERVRMLLLKLGLLSS